MPNIKVGTTHATYRVYFRKINLLVLFYKEFSLYYDHHTKRIHTISGKTRSSLMLNQALRVVNAKLWSNKKVKTTHFSIYKER
jgi:hypothetical protein